jgi:type I restriction enzyme, S subunit
VNPIPPRADHDKIVTEIERRLSVTETLETMITATLTRAERLRQSVLTEAFAGRLMPQEPADEPASTPLEQVKSSHIHHHTSGQSQRKPTQAALAGLE